MKKRLGFLVLFVVCLTHAQFNVDVSLSNNYGINTAILYTLDGSKFIVSSTESKQNNSWNFKVAKRYVGMMKVYFPEVNETVNFISENRNVKMTLEFGGNKIKNANYLDEANVLMERMQEVQQKNEQIFPALVQIKEYYEDSSDFGKALSKEIERLGFPVIIDENKFPFISYYKDNYNKFVVQNSTGKLPTREEISKFITNSNEYLETSSLLRPVLISYINAGTKEDVESSIENLISRLDVETPRGQTVLSEIIEIFDVYSMIDLKEKLLSKAKNLKCKIHDRLASTLKVNKNTEIGATFPDYKFTSNLKNSTFKTLHEVKAKKKIVVFWSSTCSHCEKELPRFIENYAGLKSKNIEIIGLSLDDDKNSFNNATKAYPWINDTELKGWNSSFVETFNINATPTYFILDENNKIISKPDHTGDILNALK